MGDKGFDEEEFCLPPGLLSDELILMNKENLFKDRRNSPLPPRTPVLTQPPSDSLSYYSNDFLVPPFSSGPNIPQPWEMMGPTQPLLGPVFGDGSSLTPSPLPLPPQPPPPPRPVAPINYQVNRNRQGQLCNFTPVPSFNTLPDTHTGTMWGHQQAGGHFGNGGYGVTPGLACGGVERRAVGYGGGMKTERVGTGVFLPRRYNNTTPQLRKKSGGSTAQPPPRLIKAQNQKFANATPPRHPQNMKFANVTPQFHQAPVQVQNGKFANVTPQLQARPQMQAPSRKFANVTSQLEAPRQVRGQVRKFANVTPPQLQAPRQIQVQNKKFANVTPQNQASRQFASGSHISENEPVMARKNAALGQEWRKYEPTMMTPNTTDATTSASAAEGMRVNNEIRLPQEWTYTYELFKRTSLDEN